MIDYCARSWIQWLAIAPRMAILTGISWGWSSSLAWSQTIAQVPSPEPSPLPELLPPLPPPEDLLRPLPTLPNEETSQPEDENPVTLVVEQFNVVGSTVFSAEELAAVLAPFTHRPLTLTDLLQARSVITQLYLDAGYVLSGSYIPPQVPEDGIVTVQVIEGRIDTIEVNGTRRLHPSYVRSRLALATDPPLSLDRLVDQLRLLQLDPLIETVSAELATGVEPGTSQLNVQVTEAETFDITLSTDNQRSPTVGSWRHQIELVEANLLGLGDGLNVGYTHTAGSDEINAQYTLPINPRNGTFSFRYGWTDSHVIEDPFDTLDINSETHSYELTYRQPLVQTPTEEFALSLTASRQESRSLFLENVLGEPIPFPALGADEEGRIRVSALRFAQEWTRRGSQEVIALRSQFNLGLDLFDSTINTDTPDSRFFSWQGQGQWVRSVAPDTLLLLRLEGQWADSALVPFEQFSLGGQSTIRGYRQDVLFTDNGLLASAEMQIPILRAPRIDGLLHIIPFFDVGTGWNTDRDNPDPHTLLGMGLGLQWQQGDRLRARLDWGIPLTDINSEGNSLQEEGVYFSILYRAF